MRRTRIGRTMLLGGAVVAVVGTGSLAAPQPAKAPDADLVHSVFAMESIPAPARGVNPAAALGNLRISTTPWTQAIGTRVSAQGVVWGSAREPFVGRLVLDGDALYLQGEGVRGIDLNGRLLRLEGKLRAGALGPNGSTVFYLDVERAEPLERLTSPYLWDARKRPGR